MEPTPQARPGGARQQRLLPFRLRLALPGIPGLRLLRGASGSSSSASAAAAAAPDAAGVTLASAGDAAAGAPAAANALATTAASPAKPKPALKPASDVLAGALARALSQSTIHPLDTLKVRMQTRPAPAPAAAPVPGLSKFGQLVPPPGGAAGGPPDLRAMGAGLASLYKGVVGAASGAGIAIGAYFACYGLASNALAAHTELSASATAFVAGGAAAAGSSVVKVPLAVCIRSVQAGVYPNVFAAASAITGKAGARGLFTGFFPTLLEDVPDMAVKFAAYESLRSLHRRLNDGRNASPQEDFAMGAFAGALAAAATTPLDVIKTRMMCAAASRPTMASAAREVLAASGPKGFLAGIGARAASNGINSAVFFCFFEAIRSSLAAAPGEQGWREQAAAWAAQARERAAQVPRLLLPPMASSANRRHLRMATAGSGLLAGAGAGGAACGEFAEAELLLCDAATDEADAGCGSRGGRPHSLSLLARASPLRLDNGCHAGQLVAAMQALRSVGVDEE